MIWGTTRVRVCVCFRIRVRVCVWKNGRCERGEGGIADHNRIHPRKHQNMIYMMEQSIAIKKKKNTKFFGPLLVCAQGTRAPIREGEEENGVWGQERRTKEGSREQPLLDCMYMTPLTCFLM